MNSFTDGSAFCPGAPKRVSSNSAKHRRVYTSSNVCHSHEWRVDTASGKTLKKRNACLHAVHRQSKKKIACIHGLRSEGVNRIHYYGLHTLSISYLCTKIRGSIYKPLLWCYFPYFSSALCFPSSPCPPPSCLPSQSRLQQNPRPRSLISLSF